MDRKELAVFFLRAGLAFALIYVGISTFVNPNFWIGFVPSAVEIILSKEMFLRIHGAFDILLGFWFVINKRIEYAALLTALSMFAIIAFNYKALDVIFRDITIFFAALALAVLSWNR